MKITNKHGLPVPIVRAVEHDIYRRVGDISVTELVKPPQILELERQHDHEITEDAADRIWALYGQAMHYVLQAVATENALQEERLIMQVDGWAVSGKPDLFEADGTLSDFKTTSAWSFVFGEKAEWVAQLNLYALLLRHHGFDVKRLQVVAILRDWQKSRAGDDDYPGAQAIAREVRLWPAEEATRYLERRVSLHQEARQHHRWPPCSPEERWARPEKWAVMKRGKKRAVKLFDSEDEAVGLLGKLEGDSHRIEHRPGVSARCADYCSVLPWCAQGQALVK